MGFCAVLRRCEYILICATAFFLPFDFPLKNIGVSLPFIKTFLELLIVLMLFIWELVIIAQRKVDIKFTPVVFPLAVFFILHIYSSVFPSEMTVWSLKYTFRLFGFGLIYFILVNFIRDKKQIEAITVSLVAGACLASLFVIIQYFRPFSIAVVQNFFEDIVSKPFRMRGLFGWPTNMAVFLGTLLPFLFAAVLYSGNDKARILIKAFYWLAIILVLVSLFLSRTRGWIAALFFGMSVLWIIALIKEKDYTTLWVAAFILFVLIIIFFATGAHNIFVGRLEPSELFRKKLTRDALSFISQHPFKGLGPDIFYWKVPYHFRTHNILLETLVNLGIPGLAVLVWFICTLFGFIAKGILKASSLKERYLQLGIIASLAAFIGHNTVDYFWHVTEILGLFWMLAGLGACVSINGSAREKAEGSIQ